MSQKTKSENESRHDESTRKKRGGVFRRTARAAGRTATFPFRGVMSAPREQFLENESILPMDDWRNLLDAIRAPFRGDQYRNMSAEERYWSQPTNWPADMQRFIADNIRMAALFALILICLSLLAILRAFIGADLDSLARWSFLVGGVGGTFVSVLLYVSVCFDFATLQRLLSQSSEQSEDKSQSTLFPPIRTFWILGAPRQFVLFLGHIPAHVHLNYQIRYQDGAGASNSNAASRTRVFIGFTQRFLIVTGILVFLFLLFKAVALLLGLE